MFGCVRDQELKQMSSDEIRVEAVRMMDDMVCTVPVGNATLTKGGRS